MVLLYFYGWERKRRRRVFSRSFRKYGSGFRTFGYPLIREDIVIQGIYTVGTTPGAVGAPYVTFVLIILFSLSLIQKK